MVESENWYTKKKKNLMKRRGGLGEHFCLVEEVGDYRTWMVPSFTFFKMLVRLQNVFKMSCIHFIILFINFFGADIRFLVEMRDASVIQALLNNTEEIASHCLSSLMKNSEV